VGVFYDKFEPLKRGSTMRRIRHGRSTPGEDWQAEFADGLPVGVEDLAHVSPLLHRHVIPNGTYHFLRAIEGDNLS